MLVKDFEFININFDFILITEFSIGTTISMIILKSPKFQIFSEDHSFTNSFENIEIQVQEIEKNLRANTETLENIINPFTREFPFNTSFEIYVILSEREQIGNEIRKKKWGLKANILSKSNIHIMTYGRMIQFINESKNDKVDILNTLWTSTSLNYDDRFKLGENLSRPEFRRFKRKLAIKKDISQIRENLAHNKYQVALNQIEELSKDENQINDEVLIIRSRLNKINQDIINGLISKEEEIININKIRYSIMKLINLIS